MRIGGISIILLLGILNMALVIFQISTGMRWLKVPFAIHKRSGMLLFFSSAIHAILAILTA